jgi:hypothetical protein
MDAITIPESRAAVKKIDLGKSERFNQSSNRILRNVINDYLRRPRLNAFANALAVQIIATARPAPNADVSVWTFIINRHRVLR